MSLILGFDTATPMASVALFDGQSQRLLARADEPVRTHGKALMTIADRVMRDAGAAKQDLAAVACGLGPGSFTGVRVGLATAKGICFALDIPLIGLSSLQILAGRAVEKVVAPGKPAQNPAARTALLPCLDARRGEVYLAAYWSEVLADLHDSAVWEPWMGPLARSPAEVGRALDVAVRSVAKSQAGGGPPENVRFVVLGNGLDLVGDFWQEAADRLHGVADLALLREIDPWPDAGALVRYAHVLLKVGHFADLDGAQPIYLRPSDAEEHFGLDLSPKT